MPIKRSGSALSRRHAASKPSAACQMVLVVSVNGFSFFCRENVSKLASRTFNVTHFASPSQARNRKATRSHCSCRIERRTFMSPMLRSKVSSCPTLLASCSVITSRSSMPSANCRHCAPDSPSRARAWSSLRFCKSPNV